MIVLQSASLKDWTLIITEGCLLLLKHDHSDCLIRRSPHIVINVT